MRRKQQKLSFEFTNPNTPEETIELIKKMIIEKIVRDQKSYKLALECNLTTLLGTMLGSQGAFDDEDKID